MKPYISVIIPVRNGARTIGLCLEAVFASEYGSYEVIVVDDRSSDGSLEAIRTFPCRLIRQEGRAGASSARNLGARHATGTVLFFIDADCLVQRDTLSRVRGAVERQGRRAIIGGTYTARPFDPDFFSRFQSLFIRYFETKRSGRPDYIASHAMAVAADVFRRSGGFREDFLPIIEDVELSHRLRRAGYRLVIDPRIEVRHIFSFSCFRSLRNAARKAAYWMIYSLRNRDLFADSGTASRELKATVAAWSLALLLSGLAVLFKRPVLVAAAAGLLALTACMNRGLIALFHREGGWSFALRAFAYYSLIYPAAVGAGAAAGCIMHLLQVLRPLVTRRSRWIRRDAAPHGSAGARP